jgi:ankyrin repeat protein
MKYTDRPEYKFFKALKNGSIESANELIEQGCDVHKLTDLEQWTYLHKMLTSPSFNIEDSSILKSIQFLLDKGLDVNAIDSYGNTPLLYAVRQRNVDGIRLLLENGADKLIEHENLEGVSALRMSFIGKNYSFDIVKELLGFGADPDKKNIQGKTVRDRLNIIVGVPDNIYGLFLKY